MPLLDLSNAEDRGEFKALPEGTYNVHIKDATLGQVKPGGKLPENTPQIRIQFEVDEEDRLEPVTVTDEEGNEKTIPYTTNLFSYYHIVTDKSYPNKQTMDNILYGFLKAVGYDVEDLKSGNFELDMDDLKGRACQAVVSVAPYERDGKVTDSNQVKYVKEAGAGAGLI